LHAVHAHIVILMGGGGVGDSVCWSWGVSNFHQTFMKRESNIINLPSQTLSC